MFDPPVPAPAPDLEPSVQPIPALMCLVPPPGWHCTRQAGHEPPCAAIPLYSLADRLAALPQFYTYKDVLSTVFGDNADAFLDAFCDESLPPAVVAVIYDTCRAELLTILLLRRLCRQQAQLLKQQSQMLQAWGSDTLEEGR